MRFLLLIIICLISIQYVFAQEPTQIPSPQDGHVAVENCIKRYNTTSEKLFYLTLSALSKYNYQVSEMQSKSGYILFTANNIEFLASISKIDSNNSILKIMPVKNNFYFPTVILSNIYNYNTIHLREPVQSY